MTTESGRHAGFNARAVIVGGPDGARAPRSLPRRLAVELDDVEIARIPKLQDVGTTGGFRWTMERIRDFRRQERILAPQPPRDAELLTGQQAADYLGVSRNALLALIRRGVVDPQQTTSFAPMRILRQVLDADPVQGFVAALKADGRFPKAGCPNG